jgi:hypothetical protein
MIRWYSRTPTRTTVRVVETAACVMGESGGSGGLGGEGVIARGRYQDRGRRRIGARRADARMLRP